MKKGYSRRSVGGTGGGRGGGGHRMKRWKRWRMRMLSSSMMKTRRRSVI